MDYREYRCSRRDKRNCLVVSLLAGGGISWLFYRSWYAMVLALPIYFIYKRSYQKRQLRKRQSRISQEFKDGMQAVSDSLLAGYSMERAWQEAEKELLELYGEKAVMAEEFHRMNAAVKMNQPLEQVLAEFAARSGCEDIESFSEVFSFAKRSGGDFVQIIRTTVQRIGGRMEVKREIDTVIAGKKLEGRIMNIMPAAILAYLNFASKEFLSLLYGNALGVLVMSAALAAYAGAAVLSERIMDIRV